LEELKGRNNMGQINLYKIDISKGEDLFQTLNNFFYLCISFYKSYKSLFYAVCRTLFYGKFYVSSYNWHIISRMEVVKKVVNSVFYPLHVFIAALADFAEPCA